MKTVGTIGYYETPFDSVEHAALLGFMQSAAAQPSEITVHQEIQRRSASSVLIGGKEMEVERGIRQGIVFASCCSTQACSSCLVS